MQRRQSILVLSRVDRRDDQLPGKKIWPMTGVRVCDLRQARYRGLAKTHLQHVVTATAINLYRLDDWWTETPRAHTRQSTFAALAA